ncbi:choice-of-anchor U domain-containing protein [Desulfosarcina cetonica]|uniref:choice-of-anchor U domain-containing protein n=1 Tax=Desulfosarcina cetonica TaxID=90730 RepID=UPI0006D046C9|nr:choice-of-anchor U domain-containing protein [Desulfosarcina cetonica]
MVRAYEGSLESADSVEVHYAAPAASTPDPVDAPDTDGDGIPDSLDDDNDNDGMPDVWEAYYGLDPTTNDGAGDLDGDGISNLDEYRAGSEPDDAGDGTAPAQPQTVAPVEGEIVSLTPSLETEAFFDSEGDAHTATQWQIYATGTSDATDTDIDNGACVMDVISDSQLTRLKVPLLVLSGDQTYQWRVRFFDSSGMVSPWSEISTFTTEAAGDDTDLPATQKALEGPPSAAANVTLLTSISVEGNDCSASIEQVTVVDPAGFEVDETTPSDLPTEMVVFKLTLDKVGGSVEVTVQFSGAAPADAEWIKYDSVNGWQTYADLAEFASGRNSVTMTLQDGGFGDADGTANGIIIDPSGLSTDTTDTTDSAASTISSSSSTESSGGGGGGGGGGCFISTIGF